MKIGHPKILSAVALVLLATWNCHAQVYSQHIVGGGDSQLPPNAVTFFSTATTNEAGAILITDTFMRGEQTNLVRITKSEGGLVVFRSHQFCHNGEPVALFTWRDGVQHFHTYPGTQYSADIEYLPSKEIRCVILMGRGYLDGFYYTNGIYYPAPDSDLR